MGLAVAEVMEMEGYMTIESGTNADALCQKNKEQSGVLDDNEHAASSKDHAAWKSSMDLCRRIRNRNRNILQRLSIY